MGEARRLGELPISKLRRTRPEAESLPQQTAPSPPVQRDLFRVETRWVPILRVLAQSGILARLGPFGIAAYVALKSSADLYTGQVRITTSLVAKNTGMSERAARTALKTLEEEGLVTIIARPGCINTFQLVERIPFWCKEDEALAGEVLWDFSTRKWAEQLQRVAEHIQQLETRSDSPNHKSQTTISVGTININVQVNHRARKKSQ